MAEEAKPAAPAPAAPAAAPAAGKKKVNWTITLIMSILFGSLGVDRFMMGHIGLGVLKLITGGAFGIWWLIDVIMIATKKEFTGVEWVSQIEYIKKYTLLALGYIFLWFDNKLKFVLQIMENKIYLVKHAKAWAPKQLESKLQFVCAFSVYQPACRQAGENNQWLYFP